MLGLIRMHLNVRSPVVSPMLRDLRAGTAPLHVALEKRLPFFSLLLDEAVYLRLIQAYYGFYQPMEHRLVQSGAMLVDFDLDERLKSMTLRSDLLALGLTERAITVLPVCDALPVTVSTEACLGILYVLEGASLGGQVLRREIAGKLNITASNGAAFLDIYGSATGRRWREFTDYLAASALDASARKIAVGAAQATFSCFESWLDSREVLL